MKSEKTDGIKKSKAEALEEFKKIFKKKILAQMLRNHLNPSRDKKF